MKILHGLLVPSVPWHPFNVLAGCVTLIVSVIAYVGVMAMVNGHSPETMLKIGVVITSFLLIAVSCIFGPIKHEVSITTLGIRSPRTSLTQLLLICVATLALIILFNGIYGTIISVLGFDALQPTELPLEKNLITGVLVIGFGPLSEEIFFRGFVLPGLGNRLGVVGGLIGSALFFSLLHVSPAIVIPAFVAGIVLGWLYLRTGSLWGCILVHGSQNAVVFSIVTGMTHPNL